MTREEIQKYADELAQLYFPNKCNIWARKNIEAELVSEACMRMAKHIELELIERAKKWLFKNTYKHIDDNKLSMTFGYTGEAIENFEKAMKE
jgi:hypothetical protein